MLVGNSGNNLGHCSSLVFRGQGRAKELLYTGGVGIVSSAIQDSLGRNGSIIRSSNEDLFFVAGPWTMKTCPRAVLVY